MPKSERGDTIIEVIFAIVIFSFLAISSLTIMNKGIATGEKALEITLVRQQVNAQAEALRYIHEATVVSPDSNSPLAARWSKLATLISEDGSAYGQEKASDFGVSEGKCKIPGTGFKPFILNARTAEIWSTRPSLEATGNDNPPPYSQVRYNADSSIRAAYGMWVESVPSTNSGERRFVDFHIRACWPAPASAVPMTLGTIVRLYDPK